MEACLTSYITLLAIVLFAPQQPSADQYRRAPDNIWPKGNFLEAHLEQSFRAYTLFVNKQASSNVILSQDLCFVADCIPIRDFGEGMARFKVIAGPPLIGFETLDAVYHGSEGEAQESSEHSTAPSEIDYDEYMPTKYRFTPAHALQRGYQLASLAVDIAESHKLFGCRNSTFPSDSLLETNEFFDWQSEHEPLQIRQCWFLASSERKHQNRKVISLCRVSGDVETAAPDVCVPFVVFNGLDTWISVIDTMDLQEGGDTAELAEGPPEPALSFAIYADGQLPLVEIFGEALSAKPLSLTVHLGKNVVIAGSTMRRSSVLKKYSEWLKIRSLVGTCESQDVPKEWGKLSSYCIDSFVNLLVNPQGDESLYNWHPAPQNLLAVYTAAVRQNLLEQLRHRFGVRVVGDAFICLPQKSTK